MCEEFLFVQPNGSSLYEDFYIERCAWHGEAKRYWNKLYAQYKKYLDSNFMSSFPYQCTSRLWELTIANYFNKISDVSQLPVPGSKRQSKPDFNFQFNEQSWFVECVTATPGDQGNCPYLNDRLPDTNGQARKVSVDEYRSRLTAAFKEKGLIKYKQGYHKIIGKNPFIIAISMVDIPFYNQPNRHEVDLSCFFSHTPDFSATICQTQSGPVVSNFYCAYQNSFLKPTISTSGVSIETDYFINPEFNYVSAVLISHRWPALFPDIDQFDQQSGIQWKIPEKNEFMLIHNPLATHPVPQKLLPVRQEFIAVSQPNSWSISDILTVVHTV